VWCGLSGCVRKGGVFPHRRGLSLRRLDAEEPGALHALRLTRVCKHVVFFTGSLNCLSAMLFSASSGSRLARSRSALVSGASYVFVAAASSLGPCAGVASSRSRARYSSNPGHRNWHIETQHWVWPVSCFRNPPAAIWGRFFACVDGSLRK